MRLLIEALVGVSLAALLAGCGGTVPVEQTAPATEDNGDRCAQHNPLRNVYYGDLHVHTANSFDAQAFETRVTPEEAYKFARGGSVDLAPLDANGHGTVTVHIDRPLDFAAVTDHSEFLGETEACITPDSPVYNVASCQALRASPQEGQQTFGVQLANPNPSRRDEICGADGQYCLTVAGQVWERMQQVAEAAYDRTSACAFTSFVAYEYSNTRIASNLHRNVIFKNEHVPFPISYFEQPSPWGLWAELHHACIDAGTGCDAIAIPHNTNESNGNKFFVEYPDATTIDEQRAKAALRSDIEPLLEIYQNKGDSECMNGLSGILGAPDELCDFEKRRLPPFQDCGDGTGYTGVTDGGCISRLDFARGILLAGLREDNRLGVNPYRTGFIGSTDTHNGTPGFVAEDTFVGHAGITDAPPDALLANKTFSPGGLAAVWAEENSRPSLFDALRRRETFATSGPRLAVRFFGGWNYPADLCADPNLVQHGYDGGVPMGGVLPAQSAAHGPTFAVTALRDAGTAQRPGTPLQRIQIIKGWIENGVAHQAVFDVAGDANNGASVDTATCTPQGAGSGSLCAVWTDSAFDPTQQAFYYARVLENPTCRWSTYMCNSLPPQNRPPACSDPTVPLTIQERAWSSPIWYRPTSG